VGAVSSCAGTHVLQNDSVPQEGTSWRCGCGAISAAAPVDDGGGGFSSCGAPGAVLTECVPLLSGMEMVRGVQLERHEPWSSSGLVGRAWRCCSTILAIVWPTGRRADSRGVTLLE
jgi:hypothetical protein